MNFKKILYKYTDKQKYLELKDELKYKKRVLKYESDFKFKIEAIEIAIAEKKSLNFAHSGHLGDIIYAVPVIRELAKNHDCRLYVKTNQKLKFLYYKHPGGTVMLSDEMIEKFLPLMRHQSYLTDAKPWEGETIDIDLDLFREMPVDRYFLSHRWYFHLTGVQPDLNESYLSATPHPTIKNKIVIVRSFRARNRFIDYNFLNGFDDLLFIGTKDEFADMKTIVSNLEFYDVTDFYEMAQIISGCRFFIGNQSFAYSIADGLKVPRLLEANPVFPVVQPLGRNAYDFYFQPHFEKHFKELYRLTSAEN